MQEIRLESLNDGPGILPFKLGPAKIISHYHSFLQYVDLYELHNTIQSVIIQLNQITPELHIKTKSLFEPHMNYLKFKLNSVFQQLKSFEINRVKRGLVDGLGSVIKSITGNLDYVDAQHYNKAIKDLQESENKLISEYNNHVTLSKDWSAQYTKTIDNIIENQNKIQTLIKKINESEVERDYDLIKYAHLAQVFLILNDNVETVSQELNKLENAMGFIRTSTVHHGILNLDSIRTMIANVSNLYGNQRVVELDIREYFDIIRIGSYFVGNQIVIVYKFPIVLPFDYDMYKLSIIPNRNNKILIPPYPFLILNEKDFKYTEAECPKSSKWYLCDDKRSLQGQTSKDCIQQLITTQVTSPSCNPVPVTLNQVAYDKLDDKHYSIHFPVPTKTHFSCGQDSYRTLQGSYLVVLPHQCYLETPQFTIANVNDHLKGQVVKIMNLPNDDVASASPIPTINLNSINLDQLHDINTKMSLQSSVKPNNDIDYSVYHTTIPLYVVLSSTSALAAVLVYRRYKLKQLANSKENREKGLMELQEVPAIATRTKQIDPNQLPAQFTTNVFHTRCSTGGGVTEP